MSNAAVQFEMPKMRTIILVGHCGPDVHLLKSAVSRAVPGARIIAANDAESLARAELADALLLVNRVLDGGFADDRGIELIRDIHQRPGAPKTMLISNYKDAQADAVAAGALPGFGKTQLHDLITTQRLREAAIIEGSQEQSR
jgi:hypothetical protein